MNGDTRLILALITRIGLKLPCNSGKKLELLEQDSLIQGTVNAIVELSRFRLSVIASHLTQLLENTSRSSSAVMDDFVPMDVLQSQLFILKILSACMTHHWKCHRTLQKEQEKAATVLTPDVFVSSTNGNTLVDDAEPNQPRRFRLPRIFDDPPALDEDLANYILAVLTRFLHQMASQEDNSSAAPPGSTPAGGAGPPAAGPAVAGWSLATFEIINDIYKNAGRVIFYISASNWNVVFTRIKQRIVALSSTTDEWPETAELKLLEVSDLNSKRLSMVLQELCGSLLHLKRSAQIQMGVVLRKAIWNWIEVFPAEFVTLYQSRKRMEGGPEHLFDICFGLVDGQRRKTVFWPLQTMLLILCPDILLNICEQPKLGSKKAVFLRELKQALNRRRIAEVAAICYVDICKAATYVSRSENSALGQLVPEIEEELKNCLFDPAKPFQTEAQVDQRLMTDCLTALFRLNPSKTLNELVPVCLAPNAHSAFRLVLVKSCNAIASEENRLPWNPDITSMYSILASPLRKLFNDQVQQRDRNADMGKKKKGVKEKFEDMKDAERTEIILNILRLYRTDPMLGIVQGDASEQPEEKRKIIYQITTCLNDPNSAIRTTAADTVLELHKQEYIEQWGPPESKMQTFWSISSQVVLAVARQIVQHKEQDGTKRMLDLLHKLLQRRNAFLKTHKNEATVGCNVPERLASNVALEIALLVLLCSADTEICSTAVQCFGHLCTEAQLTDDVDEPQPSQPTIVENMSVYQELSEAPFIVTGRMAQQKRIRRLLRLMTKPTPGNLSAWEEAWKRWKMLTTLVARPVDEQSVEPAGGSLRGIIPPLGFGRLANAAVTDITEAQTTEWHNYTGFLSALGGCCANETTAITLSDDRTNSLGSDSSARRVSAPDPNYQNMVEMFVREMVDLLVCDSVYVREIVKETLGADLSPRLYVVLFQQLEALVAKFFDGDGQAQCTERFTLFVEQAISVLKLILDRIQDVSEMYTVDFGSLVLSFAKYLHRLGTGHVALRIKVKMCQLSEILMAKKDYVSLRQEIKLRNWLLEIIIEWTSDYALKGDGQAGMESSTNKNERLHRDLDQACLKTIVALLAQLPLQPNDTVHEADLSKSKSSLFYRYFSFFIKLLNRCRILEAIDNGTHSAKNNQDLQMLLSKSKEYVKDLGPLKDYTILALSNLLSANIDSGLQFSLQMGYHDDTKTRTAFMQVLTNILNQGAEFDGLAETALNDRYHKIVDLITESNLSIAMSLCDVCPVGDVDEVAQLLLTVFESRNKILPLLKAVIEKEVAQTDNESELFRRSCMATRMLTSFAKTHGNEYLRQTLQGILQDLVKESNDLSFELDPDRSTPNCDANKNLANLKEVAQRFLNVICASTDKVPRSFREVCHTICTSVEERFPEAKFTAVGAFIFLRFFCPAIVAPETDNLVKPIQSKEIRRGLLLITKVITNLANNVLFGAKEPFMTVLNDFLSSNIYKVTTFLRDVSILDHESGTVIAEPNQETSTLPRLEDADRRALHKHLADNSERIGKDLITRRVKLMNATGLSDVDQAQANKRAFDRLSTLLAQLGPAPETRKREFAHITAQAHHYDQYNQLFTDFMHRNVKRDPESIKSKMLFYEGGQSRERRPVFYFIARRLIAEATDMELLMYYVLKTIEPYMTRPYEVLVDLTQFGHANEIQSQWVLQFIQILPYECVENLAALYLYNTNTAFKKFSKKLSRPLSHKIWKKTICLCTLNELHEYIAPAEVGLPPSTTALDNDNIATFSPVTKISHYRMQVPVTMKISNDTIQVITMRKQDLFYGLSCILNDVYHISDIDDISLSSHKNDDNEFVIKHDRSKSSFAFTSPKRELIMQAIRAAKARFQMARPSLIPERAIRPSDVPGKLLNMALLNIGSEDHNLRLAAYNLLVALSLTFNFDVGNQLLSAKGLCIPANNTRFVVSISERLAATADTLTLELLSEFFDGFKKSSTSLKHLCLQYMAPWLKNLANYSRNTPDSQHNLAKTREILRNLIELTAKETEMYTTVQLQVWSSLEKVDEITNLIIDEFINYAVEHGISSPQAETVANTIVTLSSVNVRGKIIARLRKVIAKPSQQPKRSLTDNTSWPEIAVLIRFNLMLSFNNRHHVTLYLPELFYVVSVLVATGPPLIRASVHGLVVNLIQSLCTQPQIEEPNLKKLTLLLTEFSEPKFRLLFGLNNMSGSAFAMAPENAHEIPEIMPLSSLEQIVQALLNVMVCGAPSIDVSNTWRARWMSLVASTAFQINPAIQPRAFVALGCLAREEVDDDLLYQILVALRGALAMFNENECSLIVSIIMCLTKIVENVPKDCRYLQQMFWLAMALVQIGHIPVFPSAIKFLLVVLKALDSHGFFAEEDIATVLLRARISLLEVAIKMDTEAGINYEHFSFAVAAALLKGLKHPGTKADTHEVLISFLDIAAKGVDIRRGEQKIIHSSMLGYLAALLPVSAKNGEMEQLLFMCGMYDLEVDNNELATTYYKIFEKLDIPDNQTALLLISLMVAMLHNAEHEPERLFLYGFLAEAAIAIPEVFALVYDSLVTRMNQIINNSDALSILDAVQGILFTVVSDPIFSKTRGNQMPFLEEIGFKHLMDCGSFQAVTKDKMRRNAELASYLVEKIIG